MRRPGRTGFALIEVIVGLALGSALVLLVHQAFGAAAAHGLSIELTGAAHESDMGARRTLERLLGGLEVGSARAAPLLGTRTTLQFSANLATHGSRLGASDTVRLDIRDGWLSYAIGNAAPVHLLATGSARFQYLAGMGEFAAWTDQWESITSAPPAVRVLLTASAIGAADTILLLIGPRG